jgi:hypothetical protein
MDLNILVKIARINDWVDMPSLYCVSKKVRNFFLKREILVGIIKEIIGNKKHIKKIPAWLLIPLNIEMKIQLNLQLFKEFDEPIFVAGGYINQMAFNKSWNSDIDIWIAGNDRKKNI